ncbi:transcription initiation factor IIB family protein [Salinibaculum rarum]|uniref:transcription initiation factor IIB family protein n=1 Tax=Salinibaculum rarum TaxID=3058903 RepID=UPI00265EE4B7|nr:transcription initiation factor IIB family protein [Salinibaculum sp. KK48]
MSSNSSSNQPPESNNTQTQSVFESLQPAPAQELADSLRRGLRTISTCVVQTELPTSVGETAAMLFRNAHQNEVLQGRNTNSVAGAAFHLATRIEHTPVKKSEIHTILTSLPEYSRPKQQLARDSKHLQKVLEIPVPSASPDEYIPSFITDLQERGVLKKEDATEVETRAVELLKETPDTVITGKAPSGVAASAIYAAALLCNANKNLTQDDVSEVADISTVTIRKTYQELLEEL